MLAIIYIIFAVTIAATSIEDNEHTGFALVYGLTWPLVFALAAVIYAWEEFSYEFEIGKYSNDS